jgi:hypothetical protein
MPLYDRRKAEPFDLRLQEASQQEAAVLAEAMERWLADGGAPDHEAAYEGGVGDVSPLQMFQPQGGLL